MICIEPQYFCHTISQFPIDAVQIFLAFPFLRVDNIPSHVMSTHVLLMLFHGKKGYTVDFVETYRVPHLRHLSNLLHQERHFSLFASVFFAEQEAQIASETTRVVVWKRVYVDVFSQTLLTNFPLSLPNLAITLIGWTLLNQISIL